MEFKGINIVCGEPGSGKTSLLGNFAGLYMTVYSYDKLQEVNSFVDVLNAGGYNLSYVKDHVVFTNFYCKSHVKWFPDQIAHDIEGFEFGLPDPEHPTKFIPYGSVLFFMEAQSFLDARKFKDFRASVSRAYELHRHWGLTIFFYAQRATLIDLNVRGISANVLEVQSLKQKRDFSGNLQKCIWTVKVFSGSEAYESYLNSGKAKGQFEVVKFVYDGDIFACYNSQANSALFLEGRENEDFYLGYHSEQAFDIKSVQEFCSKHSLNNLAESNYYKGGTSKKSDKGK